ncbi:MAG: MFS transporter [Dehalococcoidia bacterium]|nr:MFS transporter [Dehalococcoidia bacterium]MCB9485978.1 MFS transporter [Thermoflexaceae bacterium]
MWLPVSAARRGLPGSPVVVAIASGTFLASFSMNAWVPFLPLYARELGATSDANALFWAGLATSFIGLSRLVSGPVWGVLADRYGRKVMLVRALAFATLTTFVAALATEPWHLVAALTCQGLFSGFIPAAVALTSVSVPDSRLNQSLGYVSAAQFLGNTIGPAIGAGIAVFFGLRGAMVAAAIMPAVAAVVVLVLVPKDEIASRVHRKRHEPKPASGPGFWSLVGPQFYLVLGFYFFLFAANQLLRLASPVAIERLVGHDAESLVGIAFTAGGVASVAGLMLVNRRAAKPGNFRVLLAAGCLIAALCQAGLAVAPGAGTYIAAFAAASLIQAALIPATNTLIATNVGRERRGTAFGVASSAQAMAFMAGPMSATVFAAWSLPAGFLIVGGLFVVAALVLGKWLREPAIADS